MPLTRQQDEQAHKLLNQTADMWLFSRNVFPGDEYCRLYKVERGDRLTSIGKKFDVPYQLLQRINQIDDPRRLGAGETIKVVKGPFHAVVDRGRFRLYVYLGDTLVCSYPVGLGASGRQTPAGVWEVKLKQVNPAWSDTENGKYYYPDDPENPLGERWIAIEGVEGEAVGRNGFGIHGTIRPDEIGKAASRGCIRLLNEDVEELYDMLIEGQSRVKVID
ncbi:MAG: L,D-transpeptidase family protein, partial [Sedimentisphaerales bacterium]|nr:L,D-transpeptidase family protein [Sedimentisphaerales bacterium]